jgi:formate-dependent nitrite reductase membrane component NrfD
LFFIIIQLKNGFPKFYNDFLLKRVPLIDKIADFLVRYSKPITYINLILGIRIGIYTGILLGTFSARPFWNSAILGPLFLVSGLSAAAALIVLLSKEKEEIKLFQKIDFGFLLLELLFLVLLIIELSTGPEITKQAVHLIMGGELTAFFWIFVMGIGLIIPAILEIFEINGRHLPAALSPIFVLIGGLLLRFLMVEAGQMSTWIPY